MFDKIKRRSLDATISTKDFTVKKWKRFIRKRALKRVEKQMKYAQKKPEDYTKEEMRELVNRLFSTKHPYFCPHGRPIIVNLGIEDIDKRFERH